MAKKKAKKAKGAPRCRKADKFCWYQHRSKTGRFTRSKKAKRARICRVPKRDKAGRFCA